VQAWEFHCYKEKVGQGSEGVCYGCTLILLAMQNPVIGSNDDVRHEAEGFLSLDCSE
jgi:hypothetical protein